MTAGSETATASLERVRVLATLPWSRRSPERADPRAVMREPEEGHEGCQGIEERIRRFVAVRALRPARGPWKGAAAWTASRTGSRAGSPAPGRCAQPESDGAGALFRRAAGHRKNIAGRADREGPRLPGGEHRPGRRVGRGTRSGGCQSPSVRPRRAASSRGCGRPASGTQGSCSTRSTSWAGAARSATLRRPDVVVCQSRGRLRPPSAVHNIEAVAHQCVVAASAGPVPGCGLRSSCLCLFFWYAWTPLFFHHIVVEVMALSRMLMDAMRLRAMSHKPQKTG